MPVSLIGGCEKDLCRASYCYPTGKMNRILWWLIAGSKGGANRASILIALKDRPCNAHQRSEWLFLDYRTIQHHLRILDENRLVVSQDGGYGRVHFFPSKSKAREFTQYLSPVGLGPSSNTCPRCPPHLLHSISVLDMPSALSFSVSTLSLSTGA